MQFRNATEIRAQAEKCFRRSQLTDDVAAQLSWLSLAQGWQVLFDARRTLFKDQFEDDTEPVVRGCYGQWWHMRMDREGPDLGI